MIAPFASHLTGAPPSGLQEAKKAITRGALVKLSAEELRRTRLQDTEHNIAHHTIPPSSAKLCDSFCHNDSPQDLTRLVALYLTNRTLFAFKLWRMYELQNYNDYLCDEWPSNDL